MRTFGAVAHAGDGGRELELRRHRWPHWRRRGVTLTWDETGLFTLAVHDRRRRRLVTTVTGWRARCRSRR